MEQKLAYLLKTVALAELEVEKARVILAQFISPNLKEIPFEFLDERKRGSLSSLEISRFFEKHQIEATSDEIRMILEYYDIKRQGKLDLETFHKAIEPRTNPHQNTSKKNSVEPRKLEEEILNFFLKELDFVRKTHLLRVQLHGTVATTSFDFYTAINKDVEDKADFTFQDFDNFLQRQGLILSKEELLALMRRGGDREGKSYVTYVEFERYILPDVVNKQVKASPEPEYMYNAIVEDYRLNKVYDKENVREDIQKSKLTHYSPFNQYPQPSTFSPENPLLTQPIPTSSYHHTGHFNHLDKYHRPTRNHFTTLHDDYRREKSYTTGSQLLASSFPSKNRPRISERPTEFKTTAASSQPTLSFHLPPSFQSAPSLHLEKNNQNDSSYYKNYYPTNSSIKTTSSTSTVPSVYSTYNQIYPFQTRERPFYALPAHYKRYPYTTPYYPDSYYQHHRQPQSTQSVKYPHNMYGSNSTAILNASYKPYHAYTRFESPLKYSEQMGLTHSPEKQKNYSSERYPISGPQPSSYYKVYDRFPADCYLIGKDADPTLKNEGAPPVTVFNHGQPSFLHQYSSVRSNERSRSVNAAYAKNPQEKMYETNSFSQSNGFRETMKMPNYNSNSSALGKTTNDFRKGLHYDYNSSEFRKTTNEFGRGSHNNLKPFGKTTNDFGKGLNYDSNSNAFRRTANDFGGRGSYNNYNSGSDSYKNDFSRTSKDGMGRHSYQPRALDATKTRKWY